ncbi:MAG: hypothetical protein IPH58_06485 [Sphingobacteriales bacterium]|nr:hypothetical protein [Sphingobacteriales bacterium]
MAQPQEITYQLDLFKGQVEEVIRPFATSETVCGAWAIKALQVKEAGEQERALTQYLMGVILFIQSHIKLQEVKQLKETAVCESMHGGVRGRGSNPPTYSIYTFVTKFFTNAIPVCWFSDDSFGFPSISKQGRFVGV